LLFLGKPCYNEFVNVEKYLPCGGEFKPVDRSTSGKKQEPSWRDNVGEPHQLFFLFFRVFKEDKKLLNG